MPVYIFFQLKYKIYVCMYINEKIKNCEKLKNTTFFVLGIVVHCLIFFFFSNERFLYPQRYQNTNVDLKCTF